MKRELEIARCGLALRSLKMGCDNLLELRKLQLKSEYDLLMCCYVFEIIKMIFLCAEAL